MDEEVIHTAMQINASWIRLDGLDEADNETPVRIRADSIAAYMILPRSSGLAVPSGPQLIRQ